MTMSLRPVDAVEITIVMDNTIDLLLPPGEGVARPVLGYDALEREQLVAEHGFSAIVTVLDGGRRSSILYDGGLSRYGLGQNLDVLGADVAGLRALVMSHGHADHHGGLEGLLARRGRRTLPLIIHPEAWRDRKIVFPTGAEVHLPPPSRKDLEHEGIEVTDERGPSMLLDGTVLVSGEVERTSAFEKGFPIHYALRSDDAWAPDPLVLDDQNVIVNVRDAGLVVVSGCSHSGVVNILTNARRLTGVDRIAGFIGGLHLSGPIFEPLAGPTVEALTAMKVGRVVAGHCTGWKTIHAIAAAMPEAYSPSSVGTTFNFGAA